MTESELNVLIRAEKALDVPGWFGQNSQAEQMVRDLMAHIEQIGHERSRSDSKMLDLDSTISDLEATVSDLEKRIEEMKTRESMHAGMCTAFQSSLSILAQKLSGK